MQRAAIAAVPPLLETLQGCVLPSMAGRKNPSKSPRSLQVLRPPVYLPRAPPAPQHGQEVAGGAAGSWENK